MVAPRFGKTAQTKTPPAKLKLKARSDAVTTRCAAPLPRQHMANAVTKVDARGDCSVNALSESVTDRSPAQHGYSINTKRRDLYAPTRSSSFTDRNKQ